LVHLKREPTTKTTPKNEEAKGIIARKCLKTKKANFKRVCMTKPTKKKK